jgi:hypothetical protein
VVLYFDSNRRALAAIDEAKPQPLMGARLYVEGGQPVDGVDRQRVLGIEARRNRCPVRAQPPVLDQQHLVAIDGHRFALGHDQRPRLTWARLTIAKQPEVAQEGAGVTQGNHQGFLCP